MGLLLAVGVWAYDDAQKDQIASGSQDRRRRCRWPQRRLGPQDHQARGGEAAPAARRGHLRRQELHAERRPAAPDGGHRRHGPGGDRPQPRGQHLRPRLAATPAAADVDANLQDAGQATTRRPSRTSSTSLCRRDRSGRRGRHRRPGRLAGSRRMPGKPAAPWTRREMTDEINAAAQSPGRDQPVQAVGQDDEARGHHEGPAAGLPPLHLHRPRQLHPALLRPPEAGEELHRSPSASRASRRPPGSTTPWTSR